MAEHSERQSAIIELFGQVGLEHPPKTFEELFSGVMLYDVFLKMITEEAQTVLNFKPLPPAEEDTPYQKQKLDNLTHLFKSIRQLADQQKDPLTLRINLKKIAYEDDQQELFELIRALIEVLIREKIIIVHLKRCSAETQTFFMNILRQNGQSQDQHSEIESLLSTIQQLESNIQEKEASIRGLTSKLNSINEENDALRKDYTSYKQEVEELRKKMNEYDELQHVFEKKDQEVKLLNDTIQQLRLTLQKQKINTKDKIEEAQVKLNRAKEELARYEDNHEMEKLKRQLNNSDKSLAQISSKMKEEKQMMKNLNDRCLKLESTVKELQNEKMELVLQASEKEEDLKRLTAKLEDSEQRLRKQLEEKEQFSRSMKDSNRQALGVELNYQFKAIAETSVDYCTNVDCQRAKQQSKTYYKRNIQLTEKLQKLTSASNSGQLAEAEKIKIIDEWTTKVNTLTTENSKLKEKVSSLSTNATGFYEDAMTKLKKKNSILKKRLEEDEQKKSKEILTMSSAIIELQNIIQDNIPNSRIVELLRKLK